ncbi:sugar phosphate isomerase/epimerase family protein [Sphingobacterium pedocola]|nr:sugar phosphate isomerase/epimerase family protein [Sphingobacterium pedocola]
MAMKLILKGMITLAFAFVTPAGSIAQQLFRPELGVCASMKNNDLVALHGFSFIQPTVSEYLKPNAPVDSLKLSEGLPVYACNVFLPGSLKAVGPEADHEGILSHAANTFAHAQKTGVRIVVFGSGGSRGVPEGFDQQEAVDQFTNLAGELAKLAATYGVVICLENLNSGETNLINTVEEAYDIAKRVNHPNFKLLVDIYHMLKENESPQRIVEAGREFVYHVDIAEKEKRTAPGVAGDDFRPYLRALREIGYTGKIALECRFDDMPTELPAAMKELTLQLETL